MKPKKFYRIDLGWVALEAEKWNRATITRDHWFSRMGYILNDYKSGRYLTDRGLFHEAGVFIFGWVFQIRTSHKLISVANRASSVFV